jgi:hypothetical protein
MTKTLDEQIAARKQQAEERGLTTKAFLVVEELGEDDANGSCPGRFGDPGTVARIFNDTAKALTVRTVGSEYPGSSQSLTVSFNGRQVFAAVVYERGDGIISRVDAYIPGAWEKKLDAVYGTVEQPKATQKPVGEKEKRARWGL